MTQDATLHVKLDNETDSRLKKLASDRGTSKGQLVREAISACYQTSLDELPLRQRQAVSAYQGGYISLGKLARAMGLHVLEARRWLEEHGIAQRNAFGDEDIANA
ncbi:ribbon-helix-helix protein, CopG family [Verrucomicrobiota bacterium]